MKRTISAMSGPGVIAHNRRSYIAENVDRNRTSLNIEYCYTDIRQMYHQLFDTALAEFNAKQKRKDRMIDNYYEKICSGKQEKPFYEVIFQIGNKDDMSATDENGELAKTVLDEFMRGFQQRNPQLQVFSAHLHMDEATPHLHIDFIPFTTGSKRGLSTRVSLKQALADQGFAGEGKSNNERNQWVEAEKRQLATVMGRYGIEWEKKGTHLEHLDVLNFKKEQRAKEVAELEIAQKKVQQQVEQQEKRLEELAPAVRNVEQLAKEFSSNPEQLLPEAGTLESARTYREKKAKPLLAQIVKVLRSLYSSYIFLLGKVNQLQADCERERKNGEHLKKQLQEVMLENKSLRGIAANYERVKKFFGNQEVDEAVKAIRQREQAEKRQEYAKGRSGLPGR